MKYQVLFDNFVSMVRETIPQNTKMSAVLADILQIEKEAVYRRLRMEVPFTFAEIAAVAQSLGLSMDNIIGSIPTKSRPLKMTLIEYVDPSEVDYVMMENYIGMLRQMRNMQNPEMAESCNILPQALYLKYPALKKFYLFKWMYLYGSASNIQPYGDIRIPERLESLQAQHLSEARNITHTNFIWDKLVFHYLVEDIKHFTSIYLITPDEAAELKKELKEFLSEMETIACHGTYPDTGKRVNFYISNINFETSYIYYQADNYKLSMLKVFTLNAVSTQDEKTFEKVRSWMHSLKRVSTLISESGEKQRVQFFERQREIVNSL